MPFYDGTREGALCSKKEVQRFERLDSTFPDWLLHNRVKVEGEVTTKHH